MAAKDIEKRNVLTLLDKREILLSLEKGNDYKDLMKRYGIGKTTIYRIKKKKDKIMAATLISKKVANSGRKTLHTPRDMAFDKCLYDWFSLKRAEGMAISGPILIAKAKVLKEEMNITSDISFSQGWLRSFKNRHGIRQLSISGEKRSADSDGATKFCTTFEKVIKEHELTPDQIYNGDETGLYWKCLPTKTLAGNEETSATGFKLNKERLTVLTCANASGRHKIKLLVIGKSKCPRALKGMQHLPVSYRAQKNAWMNKVIFRDWFFQEFVPAARENMQKLAKSDSKCLLLLDNCSAHPDETELVSDCGNIFACYLPPNVTSLIQPMDQGIIRNLKCLYKTDFMLQMMNSNTGPVEFQRRFNIKDAILNVAAAWDSVKVDTLSNGWLTLMPIAIKNLMGERKKDLHEYKEQQKDSDLQQLTGTMRFSAQNYQLQTLEAEDVEEWIEEENREELAVISHDHESIECFTSPASSDSDLMNDSNSKLSWAQTEISMDTVLKFIEQTPCFNGDDIMLAYHLKKTFITHKIHNQKLVEVRKCLKNAIEASTNQTHDNATNTIHQ